MRAGAALAALALGGALAAYPALAAPRLWLLEVALGGSGVLALALSLWRRPLALGAALVALAAELVTLDVLLARSGAALVAFAAGLLTLGELVALSGGLRAVELIERRLLARTAAHLVAVALGGAAAAAAVRLAAGVAIGGGLRAAALGIAAAVALLAATAALAAAGGRDGE